MICPFFGKNEDYCDVGCSYISPSDVKKIIQFCSSYPDRCPTYQYLAERHPEVANQPSPEEHFPSPSDISHPPPPAAATRKVGTAWRRPRRSSPPRKKNATASAASPDILSNPAPSGLLAFGLTLALVSLNHTGLLPLDDIILGMGIFYGGLCQIIVGFIEWKRFRPFGATAFTSLGLFWLSLMAMAMFSGSGFSHFHGDPAMAAYLVLWGGFSLVLFFGALRLNRSLQLVLGSLVLFYFLLVTSIAFKSPFLLTLAGWDGILCAFSAIYTGIAQILNEIFGRSVVPLGESRASRAAMIQKHIL